MTVLLGILFQGISLMMAAVMSVASLFFPAGESYAPLKEAELLLHCAVISDVHMESYEFHRFSTLRKALTDMANAKVRNDVLALVGDNTMNAQWTEYFMLYAHLSAYNRAEQTLLAMGNHDVNEGENTPATAIARHNAFYNAYTGSENNAAYYYRVVKGYYFLVLGSEGAAGTNAYISPAQLSWLSETMALAAQSQKPIFVFLHQPVNDLPGNDWGVGGGIGEQSQAVWDILNAYQNVLLFSGHLHNSIDYIGPVQRENVTLVNLPCFTTDDNYNGQNSESGFGYQVEVYPDSVELRARNFENGNWLESLQYTVPLQ